MNVNISKYLRYIETNISLQRIIQAAASTNVRWFFGGRVMGLALILEEIGASDILT